MKKIILIISLIFACTSCIVKKGQWIDEGKCRAKKANFTLIKTPFEETTKLVFNKVYLGGINTKSYGISFYPDGRLVYFVSKGNNDLTNKDIMGKNWDNAMYIGYWRVKKDEIKLQYFVCGNSGTYIEKKGTIKGDTIFFERICGSNPFNKEICFDKYTLSKMEID